MENDVLVLLLSKTTIPQAQPRNESSIKKPPYRKRNHAMNLLLKTTIPHAQPRSESVIKTTIPQGQPRNESTIKNHHTASANTQ
jgi:hypothetical protein